MSRPSVLAYRLKTSTGVVDVSPAAPPSSGQVLRATGTSTATWQTITGDGGSRLDLEAIGELARIIDLDMDFIYLKDAFTINSITLACPKTPDAGTIEVELFKIAAPDGSPVTLYTTQPLPTITCNGGYAWASFSGVDLPDITALLADSVLLARVTGAPSYAYDLKVSVFS